MRYPLAAIRLAGVLARREEPRAPVQITANKLVS
jgi:hypothetical protein